MINAFLFALSVTLPNVFLLILGKILRVKNKISLTFCNEASALVFHWGLPLMLFISLVSEPIDYGTQLKLVSSGVVLTTLLFAGAEFYAHLFIAEPKDKGSFVQGVFRHNLGIVGLALIQNAYGASGIHAGAVYMGLITILLNIYSVITLSRTAGGTLPEKAFQLIQKIAKNPLIIAIFIALIINYLGWRVPETLLKTSQYLAAIALPLALICAGATFDFNSIKQTGGWRDAAVQASIGRLIIAPSLAVLIGLVFGFRGEQMGVLFLMTATPVAAASYIMAKAMGSNATIAANIMGITTVGSMFTTAIGITLLRSFHLM